MKKLLLLIVFFSLYSLNSLSQTFYVSSGYSYAYYSGGSNVYRITLNGSGYTSQILDKGSINQTFYSIAIQGNTLYYLNGNNSLFKATISNDKLIDNTEIATGVFGNSLTIDKDGTIYIASSVVLYKWSSKSGLIRFPNYLPSPASGDLIFYKQDLFLAAGNGINKVNLNDVSQSSNYIPANLAIYGLASVANGATKNKVYALLPAYPAIGTNVMELDMESRQILGTAFTLPFEVLDAASEVEDGTTVAIQVDSIKSFVDCNSPGKGIIKVITKPHAAVYNYTLNNSVNNTTGIFTDVTPGIQKLKIVSPYEVKDTTFTINTFVSPKPVITVEKQNALCDVAGKIKLALTISNGDLYKIKYGNDIYTTNTKIFENLLPGNYHFDILNEFDCPVEEVNVLLKRDQCTIKYDKLQIQRECNVIDKGTIQVLTNPHIDQYTYTLNNSTSNTTGLFQMLEPGPYTIKIKSAEDEKEVTAIIPDYSLTKPTITYSTKNPTCDLLGELTFNVNNGLGNTYKISYNNRTVPFDQPVKGLASGPYHFTIKGSDGCLVDELDITIKQDKCTIKFDKLAIEQQCDIVKKGMVTVITKPHTDNYTYSLTNNGSNTTGLFKNLPPADYTLKIVSPEDTVSMPVSIPNYGLTEPTVNYTATNPLCAEKGKIQFNLTPGYKVKYNNNTFDYNHIFTSMEVGSYSFIILKPNGCISDELTVNLVYEPCPIEINTTSVTQECNILGKGVIQVTGMPIPEQYTYTLNNGTSNHTGTFNMLAPGKYTVKVSASGGNTPKDVSIEVPDYNLTKPKYQVKLKRPLCDLLGSIKLQVTTNPSLYNIEFKSVVYSFDYTFDNLTPGTYNFKIIKKDGCIAEQLSVKLERESCNPVVFPNAFTPNGDGINDIFRPNQDSRANNYQLVIYNRHGSMLFTSKDLRTGWDGRYQGSNMPLGTYYWMVTYLDELGKATVQKGFVTLVR